MVLHPPISSDTTITGYLSLSIYIFISHIDLSFFNPLYPIFISPPYPVIWSFRRPIVLQSCDSCLWASRIDAWIPRMGGWGKPARPWGKPRGKWSTNGGLKKHLWQWKMGVFEICLWNTLLNELTLTLENYTSHHISQWKTSKLHTTYHQLPVSGQYFAVAKNGDLNRYPTTFQEGSPTCPWQHFFGWSGGSCSAYIPSYGGLLPWFYPQNQVTPTAPLG